MSQVLASNQLEEGTREEEGRPYPLKKKKGIRYQTYDPQLNAELHMLTLQGFYAKDL